MAVLPQVGSRIGRGTVMGYGGLAVFPYAGDRVFTTGVNTVGVYVRDIESPGFLSGIAAPNKNPANGRLAGSNFWCGRQDSNLHTLRRWNLNPVRLPIPPLPHPEPGRPQRARIITEQFLVRREFHHGASVRAVCDQFCADVRQVCQGDTMGDLVIVVYAQITRQALPHLLA